VANEHGTRVALGWSCASALQVKTGRMKSRASAPQLCLPERSKPIRPSNRFAKSKDPFQPVRPQAPQGISTTTVILRPAPFAGRRTYATRLLSWNQNPHPRRTRTLCNHGRRLPSPDTQRPEQWIWSSYRSYAYGEEGLVRLNQ
jgi:hypothetical protein